MSHKVIRAFYDKTDNLKPYKRGDSYTHDDEQRIAFLVKEGFLEGKQRPKSEKRTTRKKASD